MDLKAGIIHKNGPNEDCDFVTHIELLQDWLKASGTA